MTESHVPDAVLERAREQFSEEELANPTLAVGSIHVWNRLGIVSSDDLVGYRTMYYLVRGARHGEARLQFVSAEETRDGKTVAKPESPAPPFRLPP